MGKRFMIPLICAATLVATMGGIASAQRNRETVPETGRSIHVIFGPGQYSKFMDFANDGLGFGDRLAAAGPLFDGSQTTRVGTAYLDCVILSRQQVGGTYYCTYVLKLEAGDI